MNEDKIDFSLCYYLKEEYYKHDLSNEVLEITERDMEKLQESDGNFNVLCGGVVYLLHMIETNFYKIGISSTLNGFENRLKALKTASPFDISVITYITLEKGISENASFIENFLHKKLKPFRKKREWFEFNKDQVREIYDFMCYELDVLDFSANYDIESYSLD